MHGRLRLLQGCKAVRWCLQDVPLDSNLDHIYNARVFEMDLSPQRVEKDESSHRHSADWMEGEQGSSSSNGSEISAGLDSNVSEDWLGADFLKGDSFWERE